MRKLLVLGSFCGTIFASMAFELMSEKICAMMVGSALLGLWGAYRLGTVRANNSAQMQQISNNVREAQKMLSESSYGWYLKTMYGATFAEGSLGALGLLDTLKHPLFIFIVLGTGGVMFLSPSFTDYSIGSGVSLDQAGKTFMVQALTLLLLSSGFAGIALLLRNK